MGLLRKWTDEWIGKMCRFGSRSSSSRSRSSGVMIVFLSSVPSSYQPTLLLLLLLLAQCSSLHALRTLFVPIVWMFRNERTIFWFIVFAMFQFPFIAARNAIMPFPTTYRRSRGEAEEVSYNYNREGGGGGGKRTRHWKELKRNSTIKTV